MSTLTHQEMVDYPSKLYAFWNTGEMDKFYDLLDEKIVDHNAGDSESGREGVKTALNTVRSAFPDSKYTVINVIADVETSMICAFVWMEGTQTGDLFGTPPSGKFAKWKEIRMVKLAKKDDGKIVTTDHWAVLDGLTMMTQLGHVEKKNERSSW